MYDTRFIKCNRRGVIDSACSLLCWMFFFFLQERRGKNVSRSPGFATTVRHLSICFVVCSVKLCRWLVGFGCVRVMCFGE